MPTIQGYHAHVYFNEHTLEQGRALCEAATAEFGIQMGKVHEGLVGPHSDWSCQLSLGHELLADVVLWLALNRKDLVVLLHPLTGDDLVDHTAHAIWMGAVRPLNLDVFKQP